VCVRLRAIQLHVSNAFFTLLSEVQAKHSFWPNIHNTNETQMHGNEGVTNINYGIDVRMDAGTHNILESPIDDGYLCSDPISTSPNSPTLIVLLLRL